MAKAEKMGVVAELRDRIANSQIVILTKFIGINAKQATALRAELRDKQVQFKVYKNTLAKRALDELGLSDATAFMDGPTAWAFADEPVAPPKVLKDFGKEVPAVQMTGGILEGRILSKDELDVLASLPPREALLGQVVSTIAAPLRNLVGVLSAVPRNLVVVLDQVREQKEESGAAA